MDKNKLEKLLEGKLDADKKMLLRMAYHVSGDKELLKYIAELD